MAYEFIVVGWALGLKGHGDAAGYEIVERGRLENGES